MKQWDAVEPAESDKNWDWALERMALVFNTTPRQIARRIQRAQNRTKRPRKPQPYFHAALVKKQKKERYGHCAECHASLTREKVCERNQSHITSQVIV